MHFGKLQHWINRLAYRVIFKRGRHFHIWLAIVLSMLLVADQVSVRWVRGMQNSTYDLLIRHRLLYPVPDRDIVIVDVDDASLAVLAPRYGRWPWPRSLMAEVLNKLSEQKPKAIVFDILFSEPDLINPESDASFAAAVAQADNVYAPMVLLDDLSTHGVAPERIPGVAPAPGSLPDGEKISIAAPYFADQMPPGRIGTDNADPDQDGVIRRFELYRDHHGWRIPSIPFQLARQLEFPAMDRQEILLNWRGRPYSYPHASFSTVLAQIEQGDTARLRRDFGGKIILIGSTAASLFDIRSTPMAKVHPGVEILANVIDNLKHADALSEPPRWLTVGLAVAFVCSLALAFRTGRHSALTDSVFVALQVGLLALSYAALNAGALYLDMTVPISLGLAYFTIARLHTVFNEHVLTNHSEYVSEFQPGQEVCFSVMAIDLGALERSPGTDDKLDQAVAESSVAASRMRELFGNAQTLQSMFYATALIYWTRPANEDISIVKSDADRILRETAPVRAGSIYSARIFWRSEPLHFDACRDAVSKALSNLCRAKDDPIQVAVEKHR